MTRVRIYHNRIIRSRKYIRLSILIFSICLVGIGLIYLKIGTINTKNVQPDSHVDEKSAFIVNPESSNSLTNSSNSNISNPYWNNTNNYLNCDFQEQDFAEIIASVFKSLAFYELYLDLILPDATIGSRLLEGEFFINLIY